MNCISVTTGREWFGLYFDLLVDGVPIQDLLHSGDAGIPYWLVQNGLPFYSPERGNIQNSHIRLVAVCGCGEYDCGHTRCTVKRIDDRVVFEDFIGERDHARPSASFVFAAAEFDAVEKFMAITAHQERGA